MSPVEYLPNCHPTLKDFSPPRPPLKREKKQRGHPPSLPFMPRSQESLKTHTTIHDFQNFLSLSCLSEIMSTALFDLEALAML